MKLIAIINKKNGLRVLWWKIRIPNKPPKKPPAMEKICKVFSGIRRPLIFACALSTPYKINRNKEKKLYQMHKVFIKNDDMILYSTIEKFV